jgi:hypothetical protein
MREKKGAIGRTMGIVAGSVASAARRGQASATTRVVIYDRAGLASMLRPGTPEHAAIAEPAETLIALARDPRSPARERDEDEGPEPA